MMNIEMWLWHSWFQEQVDQRGLIFQNQGEWHELLQNFLIALHASE